MSQRADMDIIISKIKRGEIVKKLVGLFLVSCLALVGCSQKEAKEGEIKVGLVTDLARSRG